MPSSSATRSRDAAAGGSSATCAGPRPQLAVKLGRCQPQLGRPSRCVPGAVWLQTAMVLFTVFYRCKISGLVWSMAWRLLIMFCEKISKYIILVFISSMLNCGAVGRGQQMIHNLSSGWDVRMLNPCRSERPRGTPTPTHHLGPLSLEIRRQRVMENTP